MIEPSYFQDQYSFSNSSNVIESNKNDQFLSIVLLSLHRRNVGKVLYCQDFIILIISGNGVFVLFVPHEFRNVWSVSESFFKNSSLVACDSFTTELIFCTKFYNNSLAHNNYNCNWAFTCIRNVEGMSEAISLSIKIKNDRLSKFLHNNWKAHERREFLHKNRQTNERTEFFHKNREADKRRDFPYKNRKADERTELYLFNLELTWCSQKGKRTKLGWVLHLLLTRIKSQSYNPSILALFI